MNAIVTDNGVTIIGYTDLAGRLPAQASQLYGTNLVNLLKLLTPEKDGQLVLDFDDVVQRSMTVVRDGEMTWPPPAGAGLRRPGAAHAAPLRRAEPPAKKPCCRSRRFGLVWPRRAALFLLAGVLARRRCRSTSRCSRCRSWSASTSSGTCTTPCTPR